MPTINAIVCGVRDTRYLALIAMYHASFSGVHNLSGSGRRDRRSFE